MDILSLEVQTLLRRDDIREAVEKLLADQASSITVTVPCTRRQSTGNAAETQDVVIRRALR